tara:strand:- start:769 stop:1398 length:630 start_codon:yes stop_codon:yes gene_type:complete
MPITINGSGTVTGISAGGLPDNCIVTADIADNNVTTPKIPDGAITQAKRSEQLTLGTTKASTSGTSIDFTGIPSWVKRVTVMFDGISTNGTSIPRLRLGDAGGVEDTGYEGYSVRGGSANNAYSAAFSAGFDFNDVSNAALVRTGELRLTLLTGNQWVVAGIYTAIGTTAYQTTMAGSKSLSDTLDRVRITTVNGTDTFDAGSINIMYE